MVLVYPLGTMVITVGESILKGIVAAMISMDEPDVE